MATKRKRIRKTIRVPFLGIPAMKCQNRKVSQPRYLAHQPKVPRRTSSLMEKEKNCTVRNRWCQQTSTSRRQKRRFRRPNPKGKRPRAAAEADERGPFKTQQNVPSVGWNLNFLEGSAKQPAAGSGCPNDYSRGSSGGVERRCWRTIHRARRRPLLANVRPAASRNGQTQFELIHSANVCKQAHRHKGENYEEPLGLRATTAFRRLEEGCPTPASADCVHLRWRCRG